jgi:general stress protein CsbA
MNTVSSKTRILHFTGGIIYFLFFILTYSLPALNLHALKDIKSFFCALIFPLIVLGAVFARLLMRKYPTSIFMLFITKDSSYDEYDSNYKGRKLFWLFNTIAFLLPVSLITFELEKKNWHSAAYTNIELYTCISLAILGVTIGFWRGSLLDRDSSKMTKSNFIIALFTAAIVGLVGWWLACEIYVIADMLQHPSLFRF